MHSLGAVKNASLAAGDEPEPAGRIAGETEVVAAADRLVANTVQEAGQLVTLYGADPTRVRTVNPGVDLSLFRPGSRAEARRVLSLPPDAVVLLFAGRVQPLKAPDVLLHAAAGMIRHDPGLAGRLVVAVVGGPSGAGWGRPDHLGKLAATLGITGQVRLEPPCPQPRLADWYRAATVVVVPSHAETFGLVAVEAQACGTPVVAAAVGGLRTAVRDGVSGVLVDGHDPAAYARVLGDLVAARLLRALGEGALAHASRFGWDQAVDRLTEVYADAVRSADPQRRRFPGGRARGRLTGGGAAQVAGMTRARWRRSGGGTDEPGAGRGQVVVAEPGPAKVGLDVERLHRGHDDLAGRGVRAGERRLDPGPSSASPSLTRRGRSRSVLSS